MITVEDPRRRLPNVLAPKNLGRLMYRLALVTNTIAGLLLCPLVCGESGMERFLAHQPEAPEDAVCSYLAHACCERSDQDDPGCPQPNDPCGQHGCVCRGVALVWRPDDPRAEIPDPTPDCLGRINRLWEASLAAGNSPDYTGGTLSASATGRLIRILLQSFLA